MKDEITLIGLDDRAAWEAATAAHGLPSHSWHYAMGICEQGLDSLQRPPRLAVVRAGGATMLLPFRERMWRGDIDIVTLPGLSGALICPDSTAPLALWRDFATQQGWICGYLQLAVANRGLSVLPPDEIRSHNSLYVFATKDWSLQASVGHNMRKLLNRSDRTGARLVTDPIRLAKAFPDLHAQSMARAGAEVEFGEKVVSCWLDDPGVRLLGAEVDGVILAVFLCRMRGVWAEAHLPGATVEGRNLHNWLIWKSIGWFAGQGVQFYNIGGYGQAGDGMDETKRRLGAIRHDLRSLRQIYRPKLYDGLCQQAGVDPAALYFPAYRSAAVQR